MNVYITCINSDSYINKNGRKYDLNAVQEAMDQFIILHEKEVKDILNDYILWGDSKKINDLGIYPIPADASRSNWYLMGLKFTPKEFTDVYREFIEENKYGRITSSNGQISIPRIECPKNNGNNIKYDSRRLFDDLG